MSYTDRYSGPIKQIPSLEVLDEMTDEAVLEHVLSSPNVETIKVEPIRILGPTLVAKPSTDDNAQEESAAMACAHKLGIRVPIVRRIIPEDFDGPDGHDAFIIMDRIHGMTLEQLWPQLGIIDTVRYALQLRKFISIMHSSKSQRGGGLANGTYCSRWFDLFTQPIPSMSPTRFTSYMNWWLVNCLQPRPELIVKPLKEHTFVHQDLVPRNFIIDQYHQLWIVDWTWGGYYPEYFEYAQMSDPRFGKPIERTSSWTKRCWRWKWILFRAVAIGFRSLTIHKYQNSLQALYGATRGYGAPTETDY